MKKFVALIGLAVSAAVCAHAAAVPTIYTSQQAANGQAVFTQNCASCHGSDLQGGVGPMLIGQDFAAASANNTIGKIFTFLSTQMPEGNGGSLTHTQYEDAMAYILSKNGYPAGTAKLDYAKAKASTIPLISQVK
ncbi:MAG: cytochrome c [Acidocella sp.]|nr:cytochrome c [Acidocella sp.]